MENLLIFSLERDSDLHNAGRTDPFPRHTTDTSLQVSEHRVP